MLKVRGCARGVIKIGNEKKNLRLQLLQIRCISGEMERLNMDELLTATRTAEVVHIVHYVNHMDASKACHDMTKKNSVVLYTTHNAPSAPPGPFQEESTLQHTENTETFTKQYTEAMVKSRVSSQR